MCPQILSNAVENASHLKILIIGMNAEHIQLADEIFERNGFSFLMKAINTRNELVASIAEFQPDVILSDDAAQVDFREALTLSRDSNTEIPFIIMMSEEPADLTPPHGVDGYIIKSDFSQLPAAVRSALIKHKMDTKDSEVLKLRTLNEHYVHVIHELDHLIFILSKSILEPVEAMVWHSNLTSDENVTSVELQKKVSENGIKLQAVARQVSEYTASYCKTSQPQEIAWLELITTVLKDGALNLGESIKTLARTELQTEAPFFSDNERLQIIVKNALRLAAELNKTNNFTLAMLVNTRAGNATITVRTDETKLTKDSAQNLNSYLSDPDFGANANLHLTITKEMVVRLGGVLTISHVREFGSLIIIDIPNTLPR